MKGHIPSRKAQTKAGIYTSTLTERAIQHEIVAFLRALGGMVVVTSRRDPGGKRTAAGITDLVVIFRRGPWTFAEIKKPKGKLRPDQVAFRDECEATGIPWQCWYSLDDAKAWCAQVGLIEEAA